jgi:hypothetical protein
MDYINLYCMGIADLSPILWECQSDFKYRVNDLVIHYCDTWPSGLHISSDALSIKVKE